MLGRKLELHRLEHFRENHVDHRLLPQQELSPEHFSSGARMLPFRAEAEAVNPRSLVPWNILVRTQ